MTLQPKYGFAGGSTIFSIPMFSSVMLAVIIVLFTFYLHEKGELKTRSLENELILVTGGSGGIGREIVECLSRMKARILILDNQTPPFKNSNNIHHYNVDLTSTNAIAKTAKLIRDTHGDPTVLINNAGVFYHGTILETPEEKLRQTFDVNIISQFVLIKEFLPAMIRSNRGHIVTMASIASFVAVGGMVDYCCTKASALAFHEGLTQELKHFYNSSNVLTTIVHPLWVDTPMIKGFTDNQSSFRQPLMTPKDVSKKVVGQIVARKAGQVILPGKLSLVASLRGMPTWLQEFARSYFSKIVRRVSQVRSAGE